MEECGAGGGGYQLTGDTRYKNNILALRGPSVEILGTHLFADSDRGG